MYGDLISCIIVDFQCDWFCHFNIKYILLLDGSDLWGEWLDYHNVYWVFLHEPWQLCACYLLNMWS